MSGPARWQHLVDAAGDVEPELADALELAAAEESPKHPVTAARYLLWSAHLTPGLDRSGRRLADAVRMLVYAAREAEALECQTMVEQIPESARRAEVLACSPTPAGTWRRRAI